MSKELLEDLLVEFDEMGFEPTTLCDNQREVDSFRNRLKQVLDYLKAIDNAKPSEAMKCLEGIKDALWDDDFHYQRHSKLLDTIEQALLKAQGQELTNGGRLLNKDLLYLSQCLKQCNELPLLYVNRTYGNKYVVPQKQFDDLTNENELLKKKARALGIIKEKNVNIYQIKFMENLDDYNSVRDKGDKLTEEEFDTLKEVLE